MTERTRRVVLWLCLGALVASFVVIDWFYFFRQ